MSNDITLECNSAECLGRKTMLREAALRKFNTGLCAYCGSQLELEGESVVELNRKLTNSQALARITKDIITVAHQSLEWHKVGQRPPIEVLNRWGNQLVNITKELKK